jgi:hypothetical protein
MFREAWGKELQEFRSSGVQEFRSSGVQEFRISGVYRQAADYLASNKSAR